MSDLRIHPDMKELLAAKAATPKVGDPAQMRKGHDLYGAATRCDYPAGLAVENRSLSCPGAGRGGDINVRIYRPPGSGRKRACVLYVHGGGFVMGSIDSGDFIAWGIADQVGAAVVSLDYRLAPEDPFPGGLDDCYAVLEHIAHHPDELGIDARRIAIWGDSAGGNLAAATCLLARDRGGPHVVAQVLAYPALTDDLSAPSYERFADSPGLTTGFMHDCWDAYLGARRPTDDPYAAPLKALDLAHLPPARIHIAEIDPLADDGRRYASALLQAGVDAELHCARGMIHGFLRARLAGCDAGAEYASICRFLRDRLASRPE